MARIRKILTQTVAVYTNYEHIEGGICADPRKCMERMSVSDALAKLGIHPSSLRVDAGHVRAVWDGWRWIADTPKAAHNALVQWDEDLKNERPVSVKPHGYKLTFRRTSKVQKAPKFSAERLAQIREARRNREKALGSSDHKRYSRVIGHTYL